jgi:2-oxoglutarate ferredoxin oxidoreductase subunit delta
VLIMSQQTNSKGYHTPELADDTHCVNCGLCALLCPDFAIYVVDGGIELLDQVEPGDRIKVTG